MAQLGPGGGSAHISTVATGGAQTWSQLHVHSPPADITVVLLTNCVTQLTINSEHKTFIQQGDFFLNSCHYHQVFLVGNVVRWFCESDSFKPDLKCCIIALLDEL